MNKRILMIFCLLAMGIYTHAAHVVFSAKSQTATTTVIPVKDCCDGHQGSIWGLAYKQGENITVMLTLYDPAGTLLMQSQTHYNNRYSSNDKKEQCSLELTFTMKKGNYQLVRGGSSEQELVSVTESILLICWDCAGNDVTELQNDFTKLETELRNEIEGKINTKTNELEQEIDALKKQLQDAIGDSAGDQAELIKRIENYERQISTLVSELELISSRLESQRTEYLTQLQSLKIEYEKNAEILELKISNLDSKYATEVSRIKSDVTQIEQDLKSLEASFLSGNQTLKSQIDTLTSQHNALQNQVNLAEQQHRNDVSAIQSQIDAKTLQIQTEHQADIKLLEQKIATLDSSNSQAIADLQRQITEKNAALTEKINTAVSDLRQEITRLESRHSEDIKDLKSSLAAVESKLETEVNKLEQTDKDLYDKISDLREKQADYYARLEILKVTHEKDMEALQKELAALEKAHKEDVAAINDKISLLQSDADKLKVQHEKDVAAIRGEIDIVVDKLDAEVRKIYLELKTQQEALTEHQQKMLEALDDLQMQITMLDKAVTERLKNLENRIRYAVYSDEKLADLVKEYTQAIQNKETEIADLDLEIREMEELGRDTTAKQEIRDRKLTELLALRNELTDIQFAIKIRNEDSEFAVHEAEIEKLKAELAALRQSSELLLQQLEEKLIATENRLLALLDEIQQEAAAENASLRKDLEDFKALVQVFIDTLREEQLSGDEILRKLIMDMDESHRALLSQLDSDFASQLEKLKFEQDVQFENLRSTINNIAYQQRFNSGSSGSYGLPTVRDEEVPSDNRDLRVSPTESLTIY